MTTIDTPDLRYTLNSYNKTVSVIGLVDPSLTKIVIPETITSNNYKVTSIGYYAFYKTYI